MWRSTPSQKSRQNHRFYVWTEAIPGMVFAPAQFDTVWTSGHFSQVNHNSAEWRCVFNISFYVDIFQRKTLGDTYPRLFLTGVPLSLRTAIAEFEIKFLFTRRLEYKNESFKVSRRGELRSMKRLWPSPAPSSFVNIFNNVLLSGQNSLVRLIMKPLFWLWLHHVTDRNCVYQFFHW